jgi:hypothetical protein
VEDGTSGASACTDVSRRRILPDGDCGEQGLEPASGHPDAAVVHINDRDQWNGTKWTQIPAAGAHPNTTGSQTHQHGRRSGSARAARRSSRVRNTSKYFIEVGA